MKLDSLPENLGKGAGDIDLLYALLHVQAARLVTFLLKVSYVAAEPVACTPSPSGIVQSPSYTLHTLRRVVSFQLAESVTMELIML